MAKLKNQITINLDDETAQAVETIARLTQRKPAEVARLLLLSQVWQTLAECTAQESETKPAHFNPSIFDKLPTL